MSRIGKQPISIPDGVTVNVSGSEVSVKGPKGQLSGRVPEEIDVAIDSGSVVFRRPDDRKSTRALHGLSRSLVANMVKGVTEAFFKDLEIQGVGYRAEVQGKKLILTVGYSHPVEMPVPAGISVSVDRNVAIRIEGADRQAVGQFAADVRSVRPPEPYKGKGVRYLNEYVRHKVGKAAVGSGVGG
ncbi:MAG: 50S ribosomal protein L6 [Myxococcota bacterium]|jgi:large subunit ribosomal protein L6|nr:50S ribosomal protein L6 [Deltaproteobacteria bacterium]MCP4244520.1 50S ribosomal protein L6 [bacterium]MDP6075864.1 50S ribosomal protein L6 [Myxococcota bacterium]MBT39423.1 50S ribosomal protein L6 [Deltaproteobacteria bacterium]MDP6243897.1 50S ribosomal protein L6 [Myxococcota bacterium]